MGHVVIDVMLKPEILDPQGQAVNGALPRLGFEQFTDVRQGKRFVLSVDGEVTDEVLAAARRRPRSCLEPGDRGRGLVRAQQDVASSGRRQDVVSERTAQDEQDPDQ